MGVTSLFNHILYFGPRQDRSRFRHIKGLTQLAWKQDIEYDKILFGLEDTCSMNIRVH